MNQVIDIHDGSITLSNGLWLEQNMPVGPVLSANVAVVHNIDMGTGWRALALSPLTLLGRPASIALYFHHEQLRQVRFSLHPDGGVSAVDVQAQNDAALRALWGSPHRQDSQNRTYDFTWGDVTSSIDPRMGQAVIVLSWK